MRPENHHRFMLDVRGLLVAAIATCILASPRGAAASDCDPNWRDYVPTIYYRSSYEGNRYNPTKLTFQGREDGDVEQNWEQASLEAPIKMYVHISKDSDPLAFSCSLNPDGDFYVFEYHFYYPRNEYACGTLGNHEHDWEWAYVVVMLGPGGWVPHAVSTGYHNDYNAQVIPSGMLFYFPDVPNIPPSLRVEVENSTHPILYRSCGNALVNSYEYGIDPSTAVDTSYPYWTLAAGAELHGEEEYYTSCGSTQKTICYGQPNDGLYTGECQDPREPPWRRWVLPAVPFGPYTGHWEDPFYTGQVTYYPFLPSCVNPMPGCLCAIDCVVSWGMLKASQLFPEFRRPFQYPHGAYGRPNGCFVSGTDVKRVLWSDWQSTLDGFQAVRVEGGQVEVSGVMADSEYVDTDGGANNSVQFRIEGWEGNRLAQVTGPAENAMRGVGLSNGPWLHSMVTVGATPSTESRDRLLGITGTHHLVALNISDPSNVTQLGDWDLGQWNLDGNGDWVRPLSARWIEIGSGEWHLLVAIAAGPDGAGILDASNLTSPQLVGSITGNCRSVVVRQASPPGVVSALGSNGMALTTLVSNGGQLSIGSTSFLPSLNGWEVTSVLDLGTGCAGVFVRYEGSDAVAIVEAFDWSWSIRWTLGRPSSWHYTPDPVWQLDDYNAVTGDISVTEAQSSVPYRGVIRVEGGDASYEVVGRSALMDGATGYGMGRKSAFVGDLLVTFGEVLVRYPGDPAGYRHWGGGEVYRRSAGGGWASPQYANALAEVGFIDPSHLTLHPSAAAPWVTGGKPGLVVAYFDSDASPDVFKLAFYAVTDDYQRADVDGERGGDGGGSGVVTDEPKTMRTWPNPSPDAFFCEMEECSGSVGSVAVFDAGGRLVTTLTADADRSGSVKVRWDGRRSDGQAVQAGIYFVKGTCGSHVRKERLVVVR